MNWTHMETVRSMSLGAKVPQRFWAEAPSTGVHLRNCTPTKALNSMTPYEDWYVVKPQLKSTCVWLHCKLTLQKIKERSSTQRPESVFS